MCSEEEGMCVNSMESMYVCVCYMYLFMLMCVHICVCGGPEVKEVFLSDSPLYFFFLRDRLSSGWRSSWIQPDRLASDSSLTLCSPALRAGDPWFCMWVLMLEWLELHTLSPSLFVN